jgi:hypothetical protein
MRLRPSTQGKQIQSPWGKAVLERGQPLSLVARYPLDVSKAAEEFRPVRLRAQTEEYLHWMEDIAIAARRIYDAKCVDLNITPTQIGEVPSDPTLPNHPFLKVRYALITLIQKFAGPLRKNGARFLSLGDDDARRGGHRAPLSSGYLSVPSRRPLTVHLKAALLTPTGTTPPLH